MQETASIRSSSVCRAASIVRPPPIPLGEERRLRNRQAARVPVRAAAALVVSGILVLPPASRARAQRADGTPPPRLSIVEFTRAGGLTLRVQGQPGHTNVIVASVDLVTWVPISTNVMDDSLCPICPFADFQDPASTNLAQRFYRCFELP